MVVDILSPVFQCRVVQLIHFIPLLDDPLEELNGTPHTVNYLSCSDNLLDTFF